MEVSILFSKIRIAFGLWFISAFLFVAAADGQEAAPAKRSKLDFKKHGGIVYKAGSANNEDYELKLDVYVPDGEGPYPAILSVHGGSWTSGSKVHLIRHAWRMAARGYVVVSINYRHAPRHKFPAQIHDCKDAVRWIRKNAKQYKVDTEKIVGYGYSAGGHLVSLVATTDTDDNLDGDVPTELKNYSSAIQAAAIGGAPCEFSWVGSRSLAFWIGATKNARPKLYRRASPTEYVDKGDPPFYMYHGSKDALVPVSSTLAMRDKLKEFGIECHHVIVENRGHFATFSRFEYLDKALDFFDKTLKDNN